MDENCICLVLTIGLEFPKTLVHIRRVLGSINPLKRERDAIPIVSVSVKGGTRIPKDNVGNARVTIRDKRETYIDVIYQTPQSALLSSLVLMREPSGFDATSLVLSCKSGALLKPRSATRLCANAMRLFICACIMQW